MLSKIKRNYVNRIIKKAKLEGLQLSESARIMGKPSFGSEPYLVTIGKNVLLSNNVKFITHDGSISVIVKKDKYKDVIRFGRIIVNENVFIGAGATILQGVNIGKNSVVGAYSLVTKDIPEGEVWAGVPAKFITTTEKYAEKCLAESPNYDKENIKVNRKEEILKLYPYPEIEL